MAVYDTPAEVVKLGPGYAFYTIEGGNTVILSHGTEKATTLRDRAVEVAKTRNLWPRKFNFSINNPLACQS